MKIGYVAKENTKTGKHSFYAKPVFNGTLSFDELCEEAARHTTYEVSVIQACVKEYMTAVMTNVLKGLRCPLGVNFLTVYPNIELSVKDYEDPETHEQVVATAKMLNAANATSRLGCTVHKKYSAQFAQNVQWQKVDKTGAVVDDDTDITQGNENVEGNQGGTTPTTNGENSEP